MIGKTISHYKILEKLGGGGMGVVYKAQDTKLDRFVALKFLPQNLNQSEEEKQRFIHEAKAASALDHNNICTIHEIDEAKDGQLFIAMALYEGQTLDQKIEQRPMKLDEAVDIAVQISEGLAKAHAKEIVHRDLKPANVMLTEDGVVKILDFGLAKLRGQTKLTKEGTTLGTAAYMSPEQAQGAEVDQRTDIFSLGALLYEMLTAQQPFSGDYESAVLYSVLNEDPQPITALRTGVPMELERTVFKCLEKVQAERYQSATDLLVDLKKLSKNVDASRSGSFVGVPHVPPRRTFSSLKGAALGGVVVILAVLAYFALRPKETVLRLSNPRQITSAQGRESYPTWSPGGDRLAYRSNQSGNYDIWVTQLTGGPPVNLTADHLGWDGTPSWSPDGSQIAFRSHRDGGGVFVMPALGGVPRRVTSGREPQWSQDGTRLASLVKDSSGFFVEIFSLSFGLVQRLLMPGDQPVRVALSWSPDEQAVAYRDAYNVISPQGQLWVLRLTDGMSVPVTRDSANTVHDPIWSPDGRFLYYISDRGGRMDLWQQRIDADYTPEGLPQALTVGVGMRTPALSRDGTKLAYSTQDWIANVWSVPIPKPNDPPATWADAQQITFDNARISYEDVSLDGQHLLINSTRGGNPDLWILSLTDGTWQQLTTHPALDMHGMWSPDGKEIAFHSLRGGNRDIWLLPANGGPARQLTRHEATDMWPVWSPDGQQIAFGSTRSGNYDIWVIPAAGGDARQLTSHPKDDIYPQWSPDGKWLVFNSNRDLWRVPANGGSPEPLTQKGGVRYPVWSRTGKEVYFLKRETDRTSSIWEVSIADGHERQLVDLAGLPGNVHANGLATDGKQLFFSWVRHIGDIWVMDVEKE